MPNADSVYLTPSTYPGEADLLVSDFSATQAPIDTYWAVQNWNQGAKMGGYAGFQQSSDKGRLVIISIWDHPEVKQSNELVYCSPCGKFETFGGEGTGMKIMTPYQYQLDRWYRMAIRSWQDQRGTCVGQWVKDLTADQWDAIAAMRFPVQGLRLGGSLQLFQENWTATHENVREAHICNSWSRQASTGDGPGSWVPWIRQKIQGSNNLKDWDGGATAEYFWVKAGGDARPTDENGIEGSVKPTYSPDDLPAGSASIKNFQYNAGVLNLSWTSLSGHTPSFGYEIRVRDTDGTEKAFQKAISPFCSQVNVHIPGGLTVGRQYRAECTFIDLFDKSGDPIVFTFTA